MKKYITKYIYNTGKVTKPQFWLCQQAAWQGLQQCHLPAGTSPTLTPLKHLHQVQAAWAFPTTHAPAGLLWHPNSAGFAVVVEEKGRGGRENN